jgi:uncharacterized protein (DUF488 family)
VLLLVIYTIGFSQKSLREFIERLRAAKIKKVIDIRLQNTSQLAGFAKKDDLDYILELVDIDYAHIPGLAPSQELLKKFKHKEIAWEEYEHIFLEQLSAKDLYQILDIKKEKNPLCLLCSEDQPLHCHRRLVAEYYAKLHPGTAIKHL